MMLPWDEMLRAALRAGLHPRAFWALSLREWRWIAGEAGSGAPPDLRALMARYPDGDKTHGGV